MTRQADDSRKERATDADPPSGELIRLQAELALAQQALAELDRQCRAEREREATRRQELHRRSRNTLALVRSVFARTIESGGSLEEIESHFRGRLDVLARNQEINHDGDSQDLENLIRNELQEFRFGDLPNITITGPEVRLPADQVQPVALAIHELVTNALKFGALSVREATLTIGWKSSGKSLDIEWAEAGVPIVASVPVRRGFSRQFIEEALPYQTGAETRFELRPGGILCLISLPRRPDALNKPDGGYS